MDNLFLQYIGWDKPAIELVADKLFDLREKNLIDFCRSTVVLPTAESGRRLREYMAGCEQRKSGKPLLMPELVLVNQLLACSNARVANEAETQAAWLQALQQLAQTELTDEKLKSIDSEWRALFATAPRGDIPQWAEETANTFRRFRSQLEKEMVTEAYGATVQAFIQRSRDRHEDKWKKHFERMGERWELIRKLFERVDALIRETSGKRTQEEARATLLEKPTWKHNRIIFACVPEVSPQTRTLLRGLAAAGKQIFFWVNADESMKSHFDAFGQPLLTLTPDELAANKTEPYWLSAEIEIPQALGPSPTLHLVQDARALGLKAVELASGNTPEQVSVISCDAEMDAALTAGFADGADEGSWTLFAPVGRCRSATHAACLPAQLIQAVSTYHRLPLYNEKTGKIDNNSASVLESFAPLLRNSLMQWCFAAVQGADDTLKGVAEDFIPVHFNFCMDKVRQILLPASIQEFTRILDNKSAMSFRAGIADTLYNAAYGRYVRWVEQLICNLSAADTFSDGADTLNQALFRMSLRTDAPAEMKNQARAVAARLLEVRTYAAPGRLCPPATLTLLQHLVRRDAEEDVQMLIPKEETDSDILGWKEAAFTRGKRLILAGMHNKVVPERPRGDALLPDALRSEIGMTSSRSREARDTFLLTALLHSRPKGEVHFIVAHQQADGTPIAPSTLLLRCGSHTTELAKRAAYLFDDAPEPRPAAPYEEWSLIRAKASGGNTETIELLGKSPTDNPYSSPLKTFSPSAVNSFLKCPLRFWLKELFGISPDDVYQEDKVDLNAIEYGNEMHAVLQQFVEQFRSQHDVSRRLSLTLTQDTLHEAQERLAAEITEMLHDHIRRQFGPLLTFPMLAQRDLLTANLRLFASRHARDLLDGWVNVFCEFPLTPELDLGEGEAPARFFMKADRVDYNPSLQQWRIIDYKSNDEAPDTTHYAVTKATSPYVTLMGLADRLMVGENKDGNPTLKSPFFRWSNLQLPLYAYGLRRLAATQPPTHEKAIKQWEEAQIRCPEILAALSSPPMPELAYYNIPKTKVKADLNLLHSRRKIGNSYQEPLRDDNLDNAMQWVQTFCLMMRRGECLYSAESMGEKTLAGDFENLSSTPDPRQLCALPDVNA